MINVINKLVGYLLNPLSIGILMILLSIAWHKRRLMLLVAAVAWFWFWGMPVVHDKLAVSLERHYPVLVVEDLPSADAILLWGGGVWGSTNYPYAELKDGADRAWHAARLWKAGKAPIIIPSNKGAELADIRLLTDLGVPKGAILLENQAVNTEENTKFVHEILRQRGANRVLLVTSAAHMLRSMYFVKKYAPKIEVIPAATDYQALPHDGHPLRLIEFVPRINSFAAVNSFIHEWIGYWGYKLLR